MVYHFKKKITVVFTLQFSCGYPARRGLFDLRIESLIDESLHCYQTKSECMYICCTFITNKIIVFFFIGNILQFLKRKELKYNDGRSYTAETRISILCLFLQISDFSLPRGSSKNFTFPRLPPVKLFLGFPKSGQHFGHLIYSLPIMQCISSFGKNSPLLTFNICIYSRLQ